MANKNEFQKVEQAKGRPLLIFHAPSGPQPPASDMKTIILTGISSGLGCELFGQLCLRDNAELYCLSRRFLPEQMRLAKSAKNIHLVTCDLGDIEAVIMCAAKMKKDLRSAIDIVFINNAGSIDPIGDVGYFENREIIASANVNFVSVSILVNTICNIRPTMRVDIVNVTTGAASRPIDGWSMYCATKAATKMFLSVLARQEGTAYRIKVHDFDPGVMNTKMQDTIRKSRSIIEDNFPDFAEKNHLAEPSDVARKLIRKYL